MPLGLALLLLVLLVLLVLLLLLLLLLRLVAAEGEDGDVASPFTATSAGERASCCLLRSDPRLLSPLLPLLLPLLSVLPMPLLVLLLLLAVAPRMAESTSAGDLAMMSGA